MFLQVLIDKPPDMYDIIVDFVSFTSSVWK